MLYNDILSVFGHNSIKRSNIPLPTGVPLGFALGNFLRLKAIFDHKIPCLVLKRICTKVTCT